GGLCLRVAAPRLGFPFLFSSRRRHTRFSRDWSSDVCSSDLGLAHRLPVGFLGNERPSETSRDTARSSPFGPLSGFAGTEILIGTNASYNASYKVAHLKSMIPDGVMHFLRGTSSGPESAILSTGSKKDTP